MESNFQIGERCNHAQYGLCTVTEIIALDSLLGGGFAIRVDGRYSDFENCFRKAF